MTGAIAKRKKHLNKDDDMSDPILLFLDKIRSEYCNYKKEKEDIIVALQKTNLHLTETINDLNDKLNSTFGSPTFGDKKRRKTNSSDDSDLDSKKLFGRVDILDNGSDKSADIALNKMLNDQSISVILKNRPKTTSSDDSDLENAKLLNSMKIHDSSSDKSIDSALNEAINDVNLLNDSETLFPQTQITPTKNSTTAPIKKILSPSNKNNVIKKLHNSPPITPPLMNKMILPKRITTKSPLANNENQYPIKKMDSWISKNQKTKNNWNMSFIQPVKKKIDNNLNSSGEVIACSQDIKSKREKSSKHSQKFRQSKLEFDIKTKPELKSRLNEEDKETFCEDIVGASPTCNSVTDSKVMRTLRKNPRTKTDDLFVFPMKKSISNESIATSIPKEIKSTSRITPALTPTKNQIKTEKSKFFDHMLTDDTIDGLDTIINSNDNKNEDTAKKMLYDDSSLFLLPSQPDDVILVEDTDQYDYNLSSMDLLAEIMRDDKETQPLLKRFEDEQIKSLQNTSTSTTRLVPKNKNNSNDDDAQLGNATKLSEIFDDKNDFTTSFKVPEKKGFHYDCDECQKHRKYLISQNVPPDEIERRLRTCRKPQKLHHTPEGFWDPCYREWPADDPRNEVLIDYRFVNKKKDQK